MSCGERRRDVQTELVDWAELGPSMLGEGGEWAERQEARDNVLGEVPRRIGANRACIRRTHRRRLY